MRMVYKRSSQEGKELKLGLTRFLFLDMINFDSAN